MKICFFALLLASTVLAEDTLAFKDLFNGKDLTGWVDVNTSKDTWSVKDGLLVCSGLPIGVSPVPYTHLTLPTNLRLSLNARYTLAPKTSYPLQLP